jgi:hypothetical protein
MPGDLDGWLASARILVARRRFLRHNYSLLPVQRHASKHRGSQECDGLESSDEHSLCRRRSGPV